MARTCVDSSSVSSSSFGKNADVRIIIAMRAEKVFLYYARWWGELGWRRVFFRAAGGIDLSIEKFCETCI